MFNFNFFRKNRLKKLEFDLKSCVSANLMTQREYLQIKKDRAIAEWKQEVGRENAKRRKTKAQETIVETFEDEEETEE